MSINDPLVPEYVKRHEYWIVKRGNETFFHPITRAMLVFETEQQALDWIKDRPDIVAVSNEMWRIKMEIDRQKGDKDASD